MEEKGDAIVETRTGNGHASYTQGNWNTSGWNTVIDVLSSNQVLSSWAVKLSLFSDLLRATCWLLRSILETTLFTLLEAIIINEIKSLNFHSTVDH